MQRASQSRCLVVESDFDGFDKRVRRRRGSCQTWHLMHEFFLETDISVLAHPLDPFRYI